MRRNSSLGSVGFSARGGRSRRRHGGSSKLPYLILIGILIVLLGIAAFLWVAALRQHMYLRFQRQPKRILKME